MNQLPNLTYHEEDLKSLGYKRIAGVDEAGRGPLAGPVVAACCSIPEGIFFEGINDSKKLIPSEREFFYKKILSQPGLLYGIGIVESFLIDKINILQATLRAMQIAVAHMPLEPDYILVDGNKLPSLTIPAKALIGGDSLSHSIMAAAILAKYTRDQIMEKAHRLFPLYGFDKHKGYGTPQHLAALKAHGPCIIHRDFAPVRALICCAS